jgi:hypothetical protein
MVGQELGEPPDNFSKGGCAWVVDLCLNKKGNLEKNFTATQKSETHLSNAGELSAKI